MATTLVKEATASFEVPVTIPDSGVRLLDVIICTDLTGSYSDDIETLETQARAIIEELANRMENVQFGVTSFADFPFSPYGAQFAGNEAFYLDQPITDKLSEVYAAIDGLCTRYGSDGPESQYEALFQIATGEGLALNGDGDYRDIGEIMP